MKIKQRSIERFEPIRIYHVPGFHTYKIIDDLPEFEIAKAERWETIFGKKYKNICDGRGMHHTQSVLWSSEFVMKSKTQKFFLYVLHLVDTEMDFSDRTHVVSTGVTYLVVTKIVPSDHEERDEKGLLLTKDIRIKKEDRLVVDLGTTPWTNNEIEIIPSILFRTTGLLSLGLKIKPLKKFYEPNEMTIKVKLPDSWLGLG